MNQKMKYKSSVNYYKCTEKKGNEGIEIIYKIWKMDIWKICEIKIYENS